MTKPKKHIKRVKTIDLIKEKTGIQDITEVPLNKPRPGLRADNQWHLFDANYIDTENDTASELEKAKWESSSFLEKSYWGYYCWPNELNVPLSKRDWYVSDNLEVAQQGPPNEDSYQRAMKPIVDRFRNDSAFVSKFIQLSIIEESKGNEKFDKKRFYFFKALFRNFGCAEIIDSLFDHLIKLVADKDTLTHECSHKLAAEIMSGLIRGSKSWPLAKLKPLWVKVRPILDKLVENMSTDNVKLWYNCFSNSFEDQDPRRLVFYINYFSQLTMKMFDANKPDESVATVADTAPIQNSFQQASCLQFLLAFNQFEWKVQSFWNGLADLFMANMNHPYKSIREKISSCLCLAHVTELDFSIFNKNDKVSSHTNNNDKSTLNNLIKFLEEKLKNDIELFDDFINEDNIDNTDKETSKSKSAQHQSAVNFLQSIFAWFGYFILKSYQPINEQILGLLPQLCSVDKIAAQEASVKSQLAMSRMAISMWMLNEKCSNVFIEHLNKIITFKSWHSRLAALQMLQNFGIFNIFLVKNEMRSSVKQIVVNSLVDEQLEVRVAASLALTGFIHSHFITVDQVLIDHLKLLSRTKPRKKDKESDKMVINLANLVKRHGGVLGLCSIVNSCPYDVPVYLPDVVTYLCQFINDPAPIQGSARKCLSEFRRTHHDNWQEHKQSFDENQLSTLADILISPNYYA